MAQYRYGKNVVKQLLLEKTPIEKVLLMANDPQLLQQLQQQKISYEIVDRKVLDKLVEKGNHQGVVAVMKDYEYYRLEDVLNGINPNKKGLLVMCDEIEDPHNLGAILRNCDATGVDGVIIKKNNAVSITSTVAKVASGALETVPVIQVTNCTSTLKQLKKMGYWVVGTAGEKSVDYRTVDYTVATVLVIGNEGKGISRLVKEECDYLVALPMRGKISSLNASVACGVMLYEVMNQRFPL